jgi:site-specific recombinase XerD
MNIEQCKQLLKSIDESTFYYLRDRCILTIFLQCGLRLSELCNIKIKDIKGNKILITGKGDKQRYAFLSEHCINIINEYLIERDDENATDESKEYLFLSDRQRNINKRTVQSLVKKYLEKAGLDTSIYHTHTTRHSFATIAYNQGMDVIKLSTSLGHTNVNTSKVYVTIDEDELQEYANNNPLNNL